MRARVVIALLSFVAAMLAVPASQAQRGFSTNAPRGIPGSVTSYGFGGRSTRTPGVPASVTSQGFGQSGVSCGNGMLISSAMGCPNPFFQSTIVNGQVRLGPFKNGRRHHHGIPSFSPYPYYGGYGYGYGGLYIDSSDYSNYANPNGGGAFTPGYQPPEEQPPVQVIVMPAQQSAPPASSYSASNQPQNAPPPQAQPETTSPENTVPTVLVFKDGHQQDVQNYAIVGQNLYVVESFTSKKIPLTELDLKATEKANEERGVEFVLPKNSR